MTKSKRTTARKDYEEQTQALEEYRREVLESLTALEDTLTMVDTIQDQISEMTAELYNHRGQLQSLFERIFKAGIYNPVPGTVSTVPTSSAELHELCNGSLN